jgi:predicted nucleic acid-binding protein
MILVDTSVWIDHLRSPEPSLVKLLENDQVATHPFVRLELALGSIANRGQVLSELAKLYQAQSARMDDLFLLVDARRLERRGIGVTDLHLIASALIDRSISIWTRDRRLGEIADQLGLRAPYP